MKNKAVAVILNFFLRAAMGICLIFMEFWCIKVCKVFTKNCNLGKAYGQGGKLRL